MVIWLLDLFFIGIPLAWLWREKSQKLPLTRKKLGKLLNALGIKRESPASFVKSAALLFVLIFYFALIIGIALALLGQNDTELVRETIKPIIASPLLLVYVLAVRVPAEEIFFRGFLVPKLGILGSSALFALAHFGYGSIAEIIAAFLLGVLISWFFKRSKSLLPIILAHSLYNLSIFLLIM